MDIRCRKTSCEFNKLQTCQAKEILVNKKIICSTFKKDINKEEIDASISLFSNKTPEFGRQRDVKTMNKKCQTDCIFNEKGGRQTIEKSTK